ncbi:sugar transferase [Sinomonas sp. ASV322]|uniref:sugar transferase n=1 Tax=Sinomonas sp. ASV322 TaxID=3041920 RepID=UPI0027DD639F|nr:sugar transferase [Sinomonas sp. ASV322]MDQ4501899.1 sugar transferase [Sinomonas sp. ASV322]
MTSHRFRLGFSDLASVIWAVAGAQLLRFGIDATTVDLGGVQVPYGAVSVVLAGVWWLTLGLSGTRDSRILGYGPEEYKRVTSTSLWLFGAIAVVSYVFQLETARGYVAVALPLGVAALLFSRWILRNVLVHERNAGLRLRRVLLVGAPQTVAHLNRQLSSHPEAGYSPVALYVTTGDRAAPVVVSAGVPVVGTRPELADILAAVESKGADTVVVSSGAALPPTTLRELGWALAARDVSLVMAPALTDVAGPRIHTTPVAGLPLIHVTTPKLDGLKRIAKRGFDIVSSLALLAMLGLPMVAIILWVKLDSPGPVIFRQARVGRAGEPFDILKFRSMVADAESRLESLRGQNQGSGLLFKMKDDPRVTRSGRFLRRYSLDELPQLVNVLNGSMSLVGPRPPLPSEVEQYDQFAHRRLLIKPGITGLWQVSGRSNLSWDDSIRLDLYYVENWSMVQDLIILLRTIKAVVGKTGAY